MAKATKQKQKKAATKAVTIVKKERKLLGEHVEKYSMLDPRQSLFLQLYYDKASPTWGNAKQSAIAAGYTTEFANKITYKMPKWWSDFIRQSDIASLIEKHVAEVLTMPTVTQAMGAFGPLTTTETIKVEKVLKNGTTKLVNKKIKVPVMIPHMGIIKEKTAVIKIAAPAYDPDRYGKKDGPKFSFSYNRTEIVEKYKPATT
jgi:hypothetical protein